MPARAVRLHTPGEFAAATGERASWRAARRWLGASALVADTVRCAQTSEKQDAVNDSASREHRQPARAGVRFGFTVGRRQARKAVQRAMVKRVLREAARKAGADLNELARDRSIDVVLRLRTALPERSELGLASLKAALRSEADSLLAQLARHLRAGAP